MAFCVKDGNVVPCTDDASLVPYESLGPTFKTAHSGDRTNPKDLLGVKKVSTYVFPAAALLHGSHAMMDGAEKYGPYNWRDNKVKATVYLDAAERHMLAWREKEEIAKDSGVHHLGHAIACLAILLDAQETGNLVDNRPENGQGTLQLIEKLNARIKARAENK